jgi:negative regulator of flagellin synthesis FlgM
MKVNDLRATQLAQIAQAYGAAGAEGGRARPKEAGPRADEASLSAEAQELLMARRAVQGAPDVRAERVAALRAEIDAGTYRVDEQALARKLRRLLDAAAERAP